MQVVNMMNCSVRAKIKVAHVCFSSSSGESFIGCYDSQAFEI